VTGSNDAQGNFAPIRDEDAVKHRASARRIDPEQNRVVLNEIFVLHADFDNGAGTLGLHVVENFHRFN
jgi:hypothetical protein